MQWPGRVELSDGSLLLRPWRAEDVPRVAEICRDPEISRWTTVPGRGVATGALRLVAEWAFRTLGLRRLELVTLPGNEASQRVAEKAGFRREGVLPRHLDHDGEPRDCVLYSAESNALEDAEAGTARA
jgi:RimJ/RimL family protein N-acetyltransferase